MDQTARRAIQSKTASTAEMLRSRQRDDLFVKNLRDNILELLHKIGSRKLILNIMMSEVPAKLAYFFFTNGMNNQTIGEEYTGIIQADTKAMRVPSLGARILAVLLECLGEQALIKILDRLLVWVKNPKSELTPEAASFLNSLLTRIRNVIPVAILAHRGLFYIFGRYYSLGKRLTGIDYIKVYGRRPAEGINWALRLLGFVAIGQCVLKFLNDWLNSDDEKSKDIERGIQAGGSCQLCLEAIPTTATPCGHLFCWQCISDWVSSRPQCPLCREHVHPSRIIYLLNM